MVDTEFFFLLLLLATKNINFARLMTFLGTELWDILKRSARFCSINPSLNLIRTRKAHPQWEGFEGGPVMTKHPWTDSTELTVFADILT